MTTCNRRITLSLCLMAAAILGIFGNGTANAAVGEKDKVTCMYPVWVGFGPVHLANELGYFREEGHRGRPRSSTTTCRTALRRWSVAISTATCARSASIQGLGRRKDTQGIIIGTIDLSTGGDGWAADRRSSRSAT